MKGLLSFLNKKHTIVAAKQVAKVSTYNSRIFFSNARQRPELKSYSDKIKEEIKNLIAG